MSIIVSTMAYVPHFSNSNRTLIKYLMKSMHIFLSLPPRVTRPPNVKKHWTFGAAFTIVSGLVTAYSLYKSYNLRKNVQHTFSYILSIQRHYEQHILSNKTIYYHWLRLLQVISKMYVQTLIENLKKDSNNKFHRYLHKLMCTTADTIFYKNYILHYVNILHHLDHNLVIHNNKIEHIKSNLYLKCRNFISGLHILARNRIPESILHAYVFFKHTIWSFTMIMYILFCIILL